MSSSSPHFSVTAMADKLGLDFALIHRKRKGGNQTPTEDRMELLVGNVKGKTAILVDDMIDTGTTISLATVLLKEAGAEKIFVLVSHGKNFTCPHTKVAFSR